MSNYIELCGMVTCRYRGPVYPIVYLSSQSLSARKTCLTASRRWGGRGEPTVRLGGKISKSIISRPNRREGLRVEAIDHVWWPCHEHRHMFSDSLFGSGVHGIGNTSVWRGAMMGSDRARLMASTGRTRPQTRHTVRPDAFYECHTLRLLKGHAGLFT